jgi:short-subunit dehydrogenase
MSSAPLSEALTSFTAVIVTGGSSGIGKSFIEVMHTLQPTLRFCNLSRREPGLKSVGLKLRHIPCDLAQPSAIVQGAESVLAWLKTDVPAGRVLLINNSGFGAYGHFPEPNLAHQLEMLDVNVRAVVDLTARLLPVLKERGGAVITVASTAAFQPTAYMAAYGASKAFVLHWSLALNEELRGTGVGTLAVCPGPTPTEFFRRAGLQQGSVSDALGTTSEAVVLASLRALAAGRAQVVPGWKNKVAAALVTKLPKPMAAWLAAKVLARFRLKKVSR